MPFAPIRHHQGAGSPEVAGPRRSGLGLPREDAAVRRTVPPLPELSLSSHPERGRVCARLACATPGFSPRSLGLPPPCPRRSRVIAPLLRECVQTRS